VSLFEEEAGEILFLVCGLLISIACVIAASLVDHPDQASVVAG
jgi:hypothetical protein